MRVVFVVDVGVVFAAACVVVVVVVVVVVLVVVVAAAGAAFAVVSVADGFAAAFMGDVAVEYAKAFVDGVFCV